MRVFKVYFTVSFIQRKYSIKTSIHVRWSGSVRFQIYFRYILAHKLKTDSMFGLLKYDQGSFVYIFSLMFVYRPPKPSSKSSNYFHAVIGSIDFTIEKREKTNRNCSEPHRLLIDVQFFPLLNTQSARYSSDLCTTQWNWVRQHNGRIELRTHQSNIFTLMLFDELTTMLYINRIQVIKNKN